MVDWRKYTIIWTPTPMKISNSHGSFGLDGYVQYSNKCANYILCVNVEPFNTFQIGDEIEIDYDIVKHYSSQYDFSSTRIVRKVSSSANTISTSGSSSDISISPSAVSSMNSSGAMEIARRLSAMVDKSGGKDEYEYKIEVANQDGKTISHSLICRRSKNG